MKIHINCHQNQNLSFHIPKRFIYEKAPERAKINPEITKTLDYKKENPNEKIKKVMNGAMELHKQALLLRDLAKEGNSERKAIGKEADKLAKDIMGLTKAINESPQIEKETLAQYAKSEYKKLQDELKNLKARDTLADLDS